MLATNSQEPASLQIRLQHVHEAMDDLRLVQAYYQSNATQQSGSDNANEDWVGLIGYVHNILKDREKSLQKLNDEIVGA